LPRNKWGGKKPAGDIQEERLVGSTEARYDLTVSGKASSKKRIKGGSGVHRERTPKYLSKHTKRQVRSLGEKKRKRSREVFETEKLCKTPLKKVFRQKQGRARENIRHAPSGNQPHSGIGGRGRGRKVERCDKLDRAAVKTIVEILFRAGHRKTPREAS